MKIEHNGQVLNGVLKDGYWTFYLLTQGEDDVKLIPDADCTGQTEFTEIQLEYGTERTTFEAPTVTTGDLTGLFKDVDDLLFEVTDPDTGLKSRLFQLGGAWAIQNLTGNGDIISQINLIEDMARIQARFIHLNGTSLIDDAVIKNGHIVSMSADKLTAGTIDAMEINVINLNASNVTAGHAEFLEAAFTALNSRAALNGTALRILNDDGSFIEMNNVPEVRSTAPNGTSVILGNGRVHIYDSIGNSKGYFGTDMYGTTRDFGTFLSRGSGGYRISRMDDVTAKDAKYYTVEYGDYRVSIIEKLVQRGELPDGNSADFVRKSNMIAQLNGWAPLPAEWPTLRMGQQIKYAESAGSTGAGTGEPAQYYTVQAGQGWYAIATAAGVPLQTILDLNNLTINDIVHPGDILLIKEEVERTSEEAYVDMLKFGVSSQKDWRAYFGVYATFEAGTNISSDRRIKENIEPTEVVALDDIDEFDFVQFDMIKTGKHTEIGMIAQDAGRLRVIDEIEGIDLQGSIMLALKGVQELHQIIKTQQDKIDLLEERLNEERDSH